MLLSEANILPRCMQCRHILAMRILSVRLTNAWIVTKRKKDLSRFLYHTKEHLAQFPEKKNGLVGRAILQNLSKLFISYKYIPYS